jgi:hypothetical protein
MNSLSPETTFVLSFVLIFAAIIAGMVFQAIKTTDKKNRFQIIGRIIGVAGLFIAFTIVWITSKH